MSSNDKMPAAEQTLWLTTINEFLLPWAYENQSMIYSTKYEYYGRNLPIIIICLKIFPNYATARNAPILASEYIPPKSIQLIIESNGTLSYCNELYDPTHDFMKNKSSLHLMKQYDIADPESYNLVINDVKKIIEKYANAILVLHSIVDIIRDIKNPANYLK